MADAKEIGTDVARALLEAIKVTGPIGRGDLAAINQGVTNLQGSLRPYDRHASDLISQAPTSQGRKDDLDSWIKSKYPSDKGYVDKMYKMWFMRTVYVLPFLLKKRDRGKNQQIRSSIQTLTIFKLVFNHVLANSKRLIQVAGGAAEATGQRADLDPEEFDPEQSSTTEELEREFGLSRATDRDQQQTETNVNRRTRRTQPSGKASSESDYRSQVAKHNQRIEDARNSVRKHASEIKKALSTADARTFKYVTNSTRAANDLAQAYLKAAQNAREGLVPGSYTACKALADFLAELGKIVVDSAATNRKQRRQMRKRQDAMEEYLQTTRLQNVASGQDPQEG